MQNSDVAEFRVTVSFLQIYMEIIMDLLDVTKSNLSIREDPKQGIFVDSLTQIAVHSPSDMFDIIQEGARNRAITSTNMVRGCFSPAFRCRVSVGFPNSSFRDSRVFLSACMRACVRACVCV